MKKNISSFAFLSYAVFAILLLTKCDSSPDEKDDYSSTLILPDSLCLVQPSWFPHSQTPGPEEGEQSPFAGSSSTNEMFHQWSWQKFLWLTKPDEGGRPLFLNQNLVKQVTSDIKIVDIPEGTFVQLEYTKQAGPNSPVLKTNPDYNNVKKSRTVYYSIHMNDKMYNSSLDFVSKIKSDETHLDNKFTFPVGSFELKAAWVSVEAIPVLKRHLYYKTKASILSGENKTEEEVALIGMHVVGVVQNHPEFIWATFEHDELSPNYDWASNSVSSSDNQLLFKKGTVSGINGIRFDPTTQLGITPYQVFDLFQYGVPRNKDGSFMETPQSEPLNFNNIEGINTCVKSQLKREKDVWSNYFYNGSIWLNMDGKNHEEQADLIVSLGNNIGKVSANTPLRGSLNCANVTMESFTQTFQDSIYKINLNNLANCFSCHSGSFNIKNKPPYKTISSPLYLSHAFRDFLLRELGNSPSEIENLKTKDEERTFQLLSK